MKKIITAFLLLCVCCTLISLGYWQTQRLQWKNNVIKQLNAEYSKNPSEHMYQFDDLNHNNQILYGSVRGNFVYNKEVLVGPKPLNGDIGYLVITPLKLETKGYILINRGWIDQNNIRKIEKTHHSGLVSVSGVFRKPDWNSFTPNNSPENNIWTKLNIQEIADNKKITPVVSTMLYAETIPKSSDLLVKQSLRWLPRNKHKQYAIFWFVMAGVFICLTATYWKYGRQIQK